MRRAFPIAITMIVACNEAPAEAPTDDDATTTDGGEESSDESGPTATPTFYQDIAPVLAQHCRGCHRQGGIAPFSFETYEESAALAPVIATAVAEGIMPPWHVGDDGSCNTYRDSRRVDDDTVDMLMAWSDAGAPAGEEAPIPAPAELPHLSRVDLELVPDEAYTPSEAVSDDYRCFVIDPGFDADRFLTAFEVHPGQPSIVHHVVLFSVDSDAEEQAAAQLDGDAPGPGYPCYGAAGTGGGRSLLVWTPGTGATDYPVDTGLRLLAGRPVIMQVHYFGGGEEDITSIDLTLANTVDAEALITGTADVSVMIPPGEENFLQSAALPLPAWTTPMKIHAVYPHMHQYGRTIRVDYDRGDTSRCLVDVPDYDFAWQQFFFYDEPIVLDPPGGGHFRITCTFDSTSADAPIHFGEGTGDEMCIAALYATY